MELEKLSHSAVPSPRRHGPDTPSGRDKRWSPASFMALVISASAGLWGLIALLTLRLAHSL